MLMDFMKKITNTRKETEESNMQYRKVSNRVYKKMLSKFKKEGFKTSSQYFDISYSDENNKDFFHIKDESLSKSLYESLSKSSAFESLPNELKGIGFIYVEKKGKVVFITCDKESAYGSHDSKIRYSISNCYSSFEWIINHFSTEDTKIYINLNTFFSYIIDSRMDFLPSLLQSISLEKYELDHDKLIDIINSLLVFCYNLGSIFDAISFSELKDKINVNGTDDFYNKTNGYYEEKFYKTIRNGIYINEQDQYRYNNLPVYLYVNIFRYAIDQNCFSDLNEFFDNRQIEKAEEKLESEEFVFSEEVFSKSLKVISENENFVVYKSKNGENNYKFLKIKRHDAISAVETTFDTLVQSELINGYKLLHSLQSETCYIMYKIAYSERVTLTEYINTMGNNETKMLKLVSLINSTFISNVEVRKKLFVDKNINLLDFLYIAKDGSSLSLGDVSIIKFNKSETSIEFRYSLAIMESIKLFLQNNNIVVDDIYKYKFMKIFSSSFAMDIIDYIKNQNFSPIGMIKKLKDTLDEKYESKIEFLENIPLNSEKIIRKITFFTDVEVNQKMKEILDCQKTANYSKGDSLNTNYISLKLQANNLLANGAAQLSESIINKLFYNFKLTNTNLFLMPEKLIISKDFVNDDNYQVIGIIWTHSKLYSLTKLIKDKAITTPQIYKVIVNLLYLNEKYGYCIGNVNENFNALLIDDELKVVFNCTRVEKSNSLFSRRSRNIVRYYSDIIGVLKEQFDNYLDTFEYFSYDELFGNCSTDIGLVQFYNKIKELTLCQEHNKWYIKGTMCSECRKIYIIGNYGERFWNAGLVYNDNVGDFYNMGRMEYTINIPKMRSQTRLNQVKLGIENHLYDNFVGLTPQKIYFRDYVDYVARRISGITYNTYDFSNVLPLDSFKSIDRVKIVLMLYKKLLPYITTGTFIADDVRIFDTMFMDKTFKGQIIIPNIILLNCVDILSSDEEFKEKQINATKKLFAQFLYNYILSDDILEAELNEGDLLLKTVVDSIEVQNFNEECIRAYLDSKDSYCKIHGVYYFSNDLICPRCLKDGVSKEMVTICDNKYFDTLKKQKVDYEGGEANIYSCEDNQIQKIFNDDVNISFKSKIIGKALQKEKLFERFNSEHDDIKIVTINKVLYSYENNILNLRGYKEEYIEGSFKISSLKDKEFVEKMGYKRKDIVEILIKVCKGIQFLHSIGGFIGDLNGGNILIKDKMVYIIDIDGMSFDEVKNCVYTNMYIYPPSAETNNITAEDDWYSFAIQAFYYLTYSHPFRGVSDKDNVPVNEMERMTLGISVLGNHGIKVPNISIGWNFMPKYMIDFFLKTFEDKKRENMLGVLQSFLQHIEKNELKFKEIVRSRNSKFSLSENVYVDTEDNFIYKEDIKLSLKKNTQIQGYDNNFLILNDECTYVFNDITGDCYKFDKVYEQTLFYAKNNKIYYTSEDGKTLFVDELNTEIGAISTHMIKKATDNVILDFMVCEEDKFILVEKNNSEGTIDIYCNMEKIVSRSNMSTINEVSILYDRVSDRWLILCKGTKTQGVVIDKNKSERYYEIEFPETILSAQDFYANTLYYLADKQICYYNVNSGVLKKKECEVANISSRIQRRANKFVINDSGKTFMYFKS